jgi:superfamily II DNA or RNA helicase
VRITLGNVRASVRTATPEARAWLESYLGVPEKRRDGLVRVTLVAADGSFPSGFVPLVVEDAAKEGIEVEVTDERTVPQAPSPTADLGWLMQFQLEAVEAAVVAGRGIIHCPTASGKTEIMVGVSALLDSVPILALTHRASLLEEIRERHERRLGIGVGVWQGQTFAPKRVTVASVDTVVRALDRRSPKALAYLQRVRVLHVDECHAAAADKFQRVAAAMVNAYYRFGYSATPHSRADQRSALVVGVLGPTLYRITTQELVAEGQTAKATVHMLDYPTTPKYAAQGAGWAEVYRSAITEDPARNRLVVSTMTRAAKPALCFVRDVEHGKLLTHLLGKRGINAETVWGDLPVPVREAAVRRLEHGDVDVIVCSVVFQEGVNIPALRSVMHAAAGKAHIPALQNLGRGTRRKDRDGRVVKDSVDVYDVADSHCGCAVTTPEGTTHYGHRTCRLLAEHTRERIKAYRSEGYEVLTDGA